MHTRMEARFELLEKGFEALMGQMEEGRGQAARDCKIQENQLKKLEIMDGISRHYNDDEIQTQGAGGSSTLGGTIGGMGKGIGEGMGASGSGNSKP